MSDRKEGLQAALATLGVGAPPVADEAQDDLFDVSTPLSLSPARTGPKRRGPGKRTQEWVQHILSRYRSPLIGLAEIAARPVRELAIELELFARSPATGLVLYGADNEPLLRPDALLEVLRLQKAALEALAPYVHQKMPQALEVTPRTRGLLVIGDLGALATGGDVLQLPLAPTEENQRVIDVTPMQSHADQSHAQHKQLSTNGKSDAGT